MGQGVPNWAILWSSYNNRFIKVWFVQTNRMVISSPGLCFPRELVSQLSLLVHLAWSGKVTENMQQWSLCTMAHNKLVSMQHPRIGIQNTERKRDQPLRLTPVNWFVSYYWTVHRPADAGHRQYEKTTLHYPPAASMVRIAKWLNKAAWKCCAELWLPHRH